ncbi:unnamed protein product, partial [marine sediment metagenome]
YSDKKFNNFFCKDGCKESSGSSITMVSLVYLSILRGLLLGRLSIIMHKASTIRLRTSPYIL